MIDGLIAIYWSCVHFVDIFSSEIVTLSQASLCGGIAFMIAFKYRRGDSKYHLIPSICAFGLASLFAQQWLSITARILYTGEWPVVSIYNTMIFAILFVLISRAKGNVARMFDFQDKKESSA